MFQTMVLQKLSSFASIKLDLTIYVRPGRKHIAFCQPLTI